MPHKDKEKKLEYQRNYYKVKKDTIDKEAIAIKKKAYYETNRERLLAQKAEYCKANKDKLKAYKEANKDKRNKAIKERKLIDPAFKLKESIKSLILKSFIRKDKKKTSFTESILGCTYQQFKERLESQFEPWMNWDNRGLYNGTFNYGWDIDHIIPLDTAETIEDIIRLNHYTNLQPLCSKVNRDIKRNKKEGTD